MVVEFAVDGGCENLYIGVRLVHGVDTLGAGKKAQELDRLGFAFLEPGNGCGCRVASGQHRVYDHDVALFHVFWHLEVVLDGLQRCRVTVQADVAYPCTGYHREHAVQNAIS